MGTICLKKRKRSNLKNIEIPKIFILCSEDGEESFRLCGLSQFINCRWFDYDPISESLYQYVGLQDLEKIKSQKNTFVIAFSDQNNDVFQAFQTNKILIQKRIVKERPEGRPNFYLKIILKSMNPLFQQKTSCLNEYFTYFISIDDENKVTMKRKFP